MTSTPDDEPTTGAAPEDGEEGVTLGLSEEGSTFEPEEDAAPEE